MKIRLILILLFAFSLVQNSASAAFRIHKWSENTSKPPTYQNDAVTPKILPHFSLRNYFIQPFKSHPFGRTHHGYSGYNDNDTPIFGYLSVACVIIGIAVGIVLQSFFALLLAIPAFVLGIIGLKHGKRGFALSGLIAGGIGITLLLLVLILLLLLGAL